MLDVQVDSTDPLTVYVAGSAGFSKSVDGGDHWVNSNSGLYGGGYMSDFVLDPLKRSILYAASSQGVYKSTDGGASWNLSNSGLPTPPTRCPY